MDLCPEESLAPSAFWHAVATDFCVARPKSSLKLAGSQPNLEITEMPLSSRLRHFR
jgi:hypothetical protein